MSQTTAAEKPPLDELMLAMDVVDTLRHRERIVERELTADDRDAELVERLREIYAGQGIDVSDAIIEQGVRDLREDRFAYTPAPPSFRRTLAHLYVSRGRWGKPVAAVATFAVVAVLAYQLLVRGPAAAAIDALPVELAGAYSDVVELAEAPEVDADAAAILARGERALADADYATTRGAIAELDSLYEQLNIEYRMLVRSSPGELSGVWRVPDDNPNAENYYLIVEAVTADGDRLNLPIVNEETGETRRVSAWGQRVSQATFDAIAADKRDDGIIQNRVIGMKSRGILEPALNTGVLPGAITSW